MSPRRLVFYVVVTDFLSVIIAVFLLCKSVCQFHALARKRHINIHLQRSVQNCMELHVTLLAPRVWKWLLSFWRIRGLMLHFIKQLFNTALAVGDATDCG